jgi:hypothetical protein
MHPVLQLFQAGGGRGRPSHYDHIQSRRHSRQERPTRLTKKAAHPVSLHRPSDLFAHHKTKLPVHGRAPQHMQYQLRVRPGPSSTVNRLKATAFGQPQLPRQHPLDGDPTPPPRAPGSQYVATGQGAHAVAEAMHALAATIMGLKSSLHRLTSSKTLNYTIGQAKEQGRRIALRQREGTEAGRRSLLFPGPAATAPFVQWSSR